VLQNQREFSCSLSLQTAEFFTLTLQDLIVGRPEAVYFYEVFWGAFDGTESAG
jgi:hypothetical protein